MGYDLHITRTKEWFESKNNPITQKEWNQFVENRPEWYFSLEDYLITNETDEKTGEKYELKVHPAVHLESELALWWESDGQVTSKNPTTEDIYFMLEVASQLSAYLIGDDGEKYCDDGFSEIEYFADENVLQHLVRILFQRPRKTTLRRTRF